MAHFRFRVDDYAKTPMGDLKGFMVHIKYFQALTGLAGLELARRFPEPDFAG